MRNLNIKMGLVKILFAGLGFFFPEESIWEWTKSYVINLKSLPKEREKSNYWKAGFFTHATTRITRTQSHLFISICGPDTWAKIHLFITAIFFMGSKFEQSRVCTPVETIHPLTTMNEDIKDCFSEIHQNKVQGFSSFFWPYTNIV